MQCQGGYLLAVYSNLPDSQAIPLEERWAQKGDTLRTITLPVPEHGEPQMLFCVQLAGEWLGPRLWHGGERHGSS